MSESTQHFLGRLDCLANSIEVSRQSCQLPTPNGDCIFVVLYARAIKNSVVVISGTFHPVIIFARRNVHLMERTPSVGSNHAEAWRRIVSQIVSPGSA